MAAQPATPPVGRAIARTTGATILARKLGDGWTIECLSHGATTTAPNRSAAWIAGSHPQGYCSTCAAIVAGKVEPRHRRAGRPTRHQGCPGRRQTGP